MTTQPLNDRVPITNPDGTPTQYFLRQLQERGITVDDKITAAEALELINEALGDHTVNAGTGLSGGGTLLSDPTLSLNASLGDLNDVDFSTPPTDGQVIAYDAVSGLWLPADQSGGGGGGGLTLIQSQTLLSDAASIDFTGIPTTYKDLVIACNVRGTTGGSNTDCYIRLNADTGANYSYEWAHWFATGSDIAQATGQNAGRIASIAASGAPTSHASAIEIVIPNYAGTAFFKQGIADFFSSIGTGTFSQGRGIYGFQWLNTAAVTGLSIFPAADNLLTGSAVSVYGRG